MIGFNKDPNAVLDYTVDWSGWLNGDTIATSLFTVSPITMTINSQSNTTLAGTVWLSAGITGVAYTVLHHITTAGGRTDERSFMVSVVDQ